MKILRETPGGPTIIQLEFEESIIVFDKEGDCEAFISNHADDDDSARPSAVEVSIALVALTDPIIRALIEEKFADA